VLVAVVVCLGILTTMLATIASVTIRNSVQVGRWQLQAQTSWLVEAAAEKAAWELNKDSDYRGETMTLEVAPHATPALIEIVVDPAEPGSYTASIAVQYPADTATALRQSKSFIIGMP
jgi:hypothetical protein